MLEKGRKRTRCLQKVWYVGPTVIVYLLTCTVIGLGGRGKIKTRRKRLNNAPLHTDVSCTSLAGDKQRSANHKIQEANDENPLRDQPP